MNNSTVNKGSIQFENAERLRLFATFSNAFAKLQKSLSPKMHTMQTDYDKNNHFDEDFHQKLLKNDLK